MGERGLAIFVGCLLLLSGGLLLWPGILRLAAEIMSTSESRFLLRVIVAIVLITAGLIVLLPNPNTFGGSRSDD